MTTSPEREHIFISYSRRDKWWLERIQKALKPLAASSALEVWVDTRIRAGQRWQGEIEQALARAKVAVLLVSQDFLASDFINAEEMPVILAGAETAGLTIVWVPVTASLYEETAIARYQAAHSPNRPLEGLSDAERNQALVDICKKIKEAFFRSREPDLPLVVPAHQRPSLERKGSPEQAASGIETLIRSQLRLGLLVLLGDWPEEQAPPNLTAICNALEIHSRKAAHEALQFLQAEGFVEREGVKKALWRISERGSRALERLRSFAKIRIQVNVI